MTCGIYMIMNDKTGQKYIGQAFDIEQRWYRHIHSPNLQHSRIDTVKKRGLPCLKFKEDEDNVNY